jgi:hypothetical protein
MQPSVVISQNAKKRASQKTTCFMDTEAYSLK